MPSLSPAEWDDFLTAFPDAHLLQTAAWGELKASFGWEVARFAAGGVGAQVLFRRLPFGFSLAYIPRGPLGPQASAGGPASPELWAGLWPYVDAASRARKAVFLKIEPDLWGLHATPRGFRHSRHSIQPQRTLRIDLSGDEELLLARMKQKTRYNIRLALKKGVVVRASADLETFHRLMLVTSGRDEFGVHSLAYYRRAYELFHPTGGCELLIAEYQGEPLAGLMVFAHGRRAWYLYGASGDEHRELMPSYLLQWEGMRWARGRGCSEYDLWGVPDEDESSLEENFTHRRGGLWGVYRFKRGFGGNLARASGPWDRIYQPSLYALYCWWASARLT